MGKLRWAAGALVVALLVPSVAVASVGRERGPTLVRKDVAALSGRERQAFVDALLELKRVPSPYDATLSWYDQFVAWHVELARCEPTDPLLRQEMRGHGGPMFLPWHRQYLVLLEDAIAEVTGKRIAVPYWDWTNPESTASVFRDDFMGGNGDPVQDHAVVTGPFRKGAWVLEVMNFGLVFGPSATTYITRNFASFPGATSLPTAPDHAAALAAEAYDAAPYDDSSDPARSLRNALEGFSNPVGFRGCMPDGVAGVAPLGEIQMHNLVHTWAGGQLAPAADGALRFGTLSVAMGSPNDPVFFLLHANIDRMWAEWQKLHGVDTYEPVAGLERNSRDDPLTPLPGGATPGSVADIARLRYRYGEPVAGADADADAGFIDGGPFVCDLTAMDLVL